MADVTMNMKVLNVTKTTAQWAQVSSVISKGLLCVEIDTNDKMWVKVGDGVHTYAELPYITDGAIESLGTLFRIMGIKASTSELPVSGNRTGDVWFVGSASTAGSDKYEEYIWTANNTWEFLGKISDPVIPVYTGGTGITIDSNDAINLDIASANSLGGIKVGTNLSIDANGVLSAEDTTYSVATAQADGLMSSSDFSKLAGIEANANNYSLPTAASNTLGGIKVGTNLSIDANGVLSADNTTYSVATSSADGLMSSTDFSKLAGIESGANNYTLPKAASDTLGGIKVGTNLSIDSNGVLSADNTTYVFDGTYNASTNKAATVSTVTNAIGALDVPSTGTGAITGFGAGKTLATLTETDGKISATFQDISIATTQVTGLGAAAVKGVTDNSTATAVTSSDTNLITGRTLYYAGYAKDSDVVKGVTVNGTAATVTSGTAAITGVATGATINGGNTISADSSTGVIALTGLVTGMSYTNASGTTSTLTPTNGNLDLTSITINCTL